MMPEGSKLLDYYPISYYLSRTWVGTAHAEITVDDETSVVLVGIQQTELGRIVELPTRTVMIEFLDGGKCVEYVRSQEKWKSYR